MSKTCKLEIVLTRKKGFLMYGLTSISQELHTILEFCFHELGALDGAYGLLAKNVGSPLKLSARGR